jgi:hypothetical protein
MDVPNVHPSSGIMVHAFQAGSRLMICFKDSVVHADLHKENQTGRLGHSGNRRLWWHALIPLSSLYGRALFCNHPDHA